MASEQLVKITVDDARHVSGLLQVPDQARAGFVLAHGAGAGMRHPFLAALAAELADHGIATLRYQFPYMERGSKRPDSPDTCHATVRAAVTEAAAALPPAVPLFAGGKSFGGRMTSQTQANDPLPRVRGLVFLGFPLHPPGQPSESRAQHLVGIQVPMLFLQGTRDDFAKLDLIEPVVARLADRAELKLFRDADHSFHVLARSGRTDAEVRGDLTRTLATWIDAVIGHAAG
jgi:predicted alpha/beta-hydrolase family hydrolase